MALLATAAFSGNVKKTPPAQATAPAVSDTGPVFDVSQLDTTVSQCADLSAFVNARWVAANPIPPDRTRWGAFDELSEKRLDEQHQLAEQADRDADTAQAGSIRQKIGWLYRSMPDR